MDCLGFDEALNLFIDNELDEEALASLEKHAEQCTECRAKLAVAKQLRDILSHVDDDIAVPLPAQAAWRSAVRLEARNRRIKRIYKVCGAVAAVCVLTLGVTGMMRKAPELRPVADETPKTMALVQADGVSDHEIGDKAAMRSISYLERKVVTDDPQTAYTYLTDILAEYGGVLEREAEDSDGRKVFVQIPGDSVTDFIAAVDHLGLYADEESAVPDEGAVQVGICVIITDEVE